MPGDPISGAALPGPGSGGIVETVEGAPTVLSEGGKVDALLGPLDSGLLGGGAFRLEELGGGGIAIPPLLPIMLGLEPEKVVLWLESACDGRLEMLPMLRPSGCCKVVIPPSDGSGAGGMALVPPVVAAGVTPPADGFGAASMPAAAGVVVLAVEGVVVPAVVAARLAGGVAAVLLGVALAPNTGLGEYVL